MKRSYLKGILLVPFFLIHSMLNAQTPGMIYEPATGAGTAVLDPNGDGYTSQTTSGFITDDQTESEIPYTSLIFPGSEPTSDLNNAPNCGFTDFVDQGDRDPAQKYLDGSNNWLFRMRIGGSAPNAKSYSILIDTDGKFGNTGSNPDPDYTLNNPGFEIEIVLATKFGVYVYDVRTAVPNCTPVISYPGTTNYQKSICGSTNCGDLDYFYDFFVKFSDLTSQFGVTTATGMRYAIIDNTAAQKSTICNSSSASDVGGVGNCPNLATCFGTIIDAQGPCAPNQTTCPTRSDCPYVNAPIVGGANTVTGTSTEASGTIITVYKNGVALSPTTVVSAGTWTLTGISPTLSSGDTIRATATASGEIASNYDCSYAVVGSSCSAPVTLLDICNSGKAVQGYATPGAEIKLYYGTNATPITPSSGYNFTTGPNKITAGTTPSTLSNTSLNWLWKCVGSGQSSSCTSGGAPCLSDGAYRVTATEPGKCESTPVWFCLGSVGTTATPTLSATTLTTASTTISGSVPAPDNIAGATVILYLSGVQTATVATTAGGAFSFTSLTLKGCDTVTVKAIAGTKCLSNASTSIIVTSGQSAAPVVTGPFCTSTTIASVSGISSEASGTSIQVYSNGVAVGSATTVSNGTWTVNGLSIAPGATVTARATAACKTQSAASAGIVVFAKTIDASLAITSSPIIEQQTSVTGTGTNGNTIQLYIDNAPIGAPVVVSGGTWTVTPLNSYDTYPLGVVTATSSSPTGCASTPSAGVTVICIPPTLTLSVSPDTAIVCSNSVVANVTIPNSQALIIYQLTNGGVNSGSSKLGTGGSITLTSATLSANTTLKVKAFKIPPGSCTAYLNDTIVVRVNAYPTLGLTVGASVNPVCAGVSTNITVASSQTGFTYQLRDNSNNALVGSAVAGTGGTINLPSGALSSNTTYNILATGVSPSLCSGQLSSVITITVNAAPAAPTGSATQTFCSSSNPTIANLTATGTSIQWYAASSGGSVLSSTVALVNGSSYYATQTVSGCESVTRFQVTVTITTAPTGTISYSGSPFCTSVSSGQNVTLTGTSGGTFSATPVGLSINSASGAITPSSSSAGSYTVTYSIAAGGGCAAFSTTTTATITTAPTATISYAGTPFCSSLSTAQAVTLTGTGGGTYSATPVGLTLNAANGGITPSTSTAGTYTVTYSIAAAGGCAAVAANATITITQMPSAGVSYSGSPYCTSVSGAQNTTLTGTSGGTFSATPAGLSLNASSGAITPSTSTAGNYTVNYSIAASGGCSSYSTTTTVTITTAPTAAISYAGTPFCTSVSTAQNVTLTGTSGGTYSATPSGLSLNAASGSIIPSTSTPGTYTVTYAIAASAGCAAVSATTTVTITQQPAATFSYSGSPFCASINTPQGATFGGTGGGTFSSSPAGLSLNASNGDVTPSLSTLGTYTVTYTIAASGGCSVLTATTSVSISSGPTASINYGGSPFCSSLGSAQNVTLTGSGGGTYSATPAGLSINSTNGDVTPSLSTAGSYTVTYLIPAGGGCSSFSTTTTVAITTAPSATVSYSGSPYCTSQASAQSVTQTGSTGGNYSSAPAGLSVNSTSGDITPSTSTPGTYTVTYTIAAANGCATYTTSAVVTINSAPSASIFYGGSPFCSSLSSAQNVTLTGTGGGTYSSAPAGLSLNASSGDITPSTSTAGTYTVTYSIVASGGCAAFTATTSITITQEPSATLSYSGSPFCVSLSTPQSVTLSGSTGGTFSAAPAGLTLNSSNGDITPSTSAVGTYTVTYTIAPAGGCGVYTNTVIASITNGASATIAYATPFCTSLSSDQSVTLTGTGGGTFSAAPAGLTISSTTGDITPSTSTAGTYTVTYLIPASGSCASFSTSATVLITQEPNASVSYSGSPYCVTNTATVSATQSGSGGGTYSSSPAGLSLNSSTGDIVPSTSSVGSYTITYTIAASGGCATYTTSALADIVNGPSATIAYAASPYCTSVSSAQSVTLTGSTGGTYSAGVGLSVNSSNGDVTPSTSTAGTYTVTYSIAAQNGCAAFSASATVTINQTPFAPSVSSNSPVCFTYGISLTAATSGNPSYSWNGPNSYASSTQNPTIANADATMNGTYSVTATENGCVSATSTVSVTTVDCKPQANPDSVSVSQNTTYTITVLGNDTDPQNNLDPSSVTVTSGPANGTVTIGAGGTIVYTPATGYIGKDSLIYQVCDNTSPTPFCDTAIVHIYVTPVNFPPVVNDTLVTLPEDSTITVCLPISDPNTGQVYTASSCGSPLNGTANISVTGTQVCITYTPTTNYNGMDSLCVIVCDNGNPSMCDTAVVVINVTPKNDPPQVTDSTIVIAQDSTITLCIPIIDPDQGQTYSSSSCGAAANGTSTVTVSGGQVCITYIPNSGFTGLDSMCVVICDNGTPSLCDTAVIHITVTGSPIVQNENVSGTTGTPITGSILTNDAPGGLSTGTILDNPNNGSINIGGGGTFTYTPNSGFSGYDTLIVQVCLGAVCIADTVFITVNPDINNENFTVTSGTSYTSSMLSNDFGTGLSYNTTPVSGPANGTILIASNGSYTYTANGGYSGPDTVIVNVCDGSIPPLCSADTLFINVIPGPVVLNETVSGTTGSPITGGILTNDSPVGSTVGSILDNTNNGTITIGSGGTFTYTPNSGFSGYDTLIVQVCFNSVCTPDTVFITVFPDINNESIIVNAGTPFTNTMATNDVGSGLSYGSTPLSGPNHGTIVIASNGSYTYTSNSGYSGPDTVIVSVCDASVPPLCSTDTIFINVNAVPGPLVINENISGITGTPIPGNILTNDSPGGVTTGTVLDNTSNGTMNFGSNGTFTYTPNTGFSGYDTLIIEVCLNTVCVPDTVFITVNPDINNESISVTANTPYTGTMLTNDAGTGLTYNTTAVSGPNNGTITINGNGSYTYTPNNGYSGPDTVIVNVCDASVPPLCSSDTIFINVNGTVPGPLVVNENLSGTTGTPIPGNILTNDSPGGVTVGSVIDNTNNGTVTFGTGGSFTYTPNSGFSGYDTLIVNVCFNSICVPDTVFITVNPDINNETITAIAGTPYTGSMITNDAGSGLTYNTTAVSGPNNGSIVIASNGSYTYTANSGYSGPDTVLVTVCDSSVPPLCSTDTIFINVNTAPGPQVVNEYVSGITGTPIGGNILTNDSPGGLTLGTLVANTVYGTMNIGAGSSFTYTPNSGYSGYDTMRVNVCLGTSCIVDTVFITVYPKLDNDTANAITGGGTFGGNVLGNDVGTTLTVSATPVTPPQNGTLVILPNGSYTYTPNAGFCGADSAQYQACDGSTPPLCQTAWLYVDVPCPTTSTTLNIPEGFSPNSDGTNDLYVIQGIGNYPKNKFSIFNRWGNQVFEAAPYTNTWNGKSTEGLRIGGDELPVGTYFYILDLGDGSPVKKGYIYLNR